MDQNVFLWDRNSEIENSRRLGNLFFILAIVFGLMLIFLEPPFVCPDENAHFINICRISHGGLFVDTQDGQAGSYITTEELDFFNRYAGYYNGPANTNRFTYHAMRDFSARPATGDMVFLINDYSTLNPTAYLIPSVVLGFLRIFFDINAYNGLLIAKFVNLLVYAYVIRWALKKTGAFRNTMFLLALMPMSIFQGASTSYDSIIISASFLLFAYATKILFSNEEYLISREDVLAICFASAMLFGAKIAYAPLVLILLAIPLKKFGDWKRWGKCVGAVATVGFVFYLMPVVITGSLTKSVDTGLSAMQIEQQEYFMSNLGAFPNVIYSTLKHFAGYWIESFVGILGWLDTQFPQAFIMSFLVISTGSAIIDACDVKGMGWKIRLCSFGGFAMFFIGTMLTMYVRWNPALVGIIGGNLIYGGQGRYFIPVALFVLLTCGNSIVNKLKFVDRLKEKHFYTVALVAFCSLCLTVMLIAGRYWMI